MGKDDGSVGDEAAGRVDNKCKQRHGETGKGPREGPYHVRIIFMLRTVPFGCGGAKTTLRGRARGLRVASMRNSDFPLVEGPPSGPKL
jgi:hypothetical protein